MKSDTLDDAPITTIDDTTDILPAIPPVMQPISHSPSHIRNDDLASQIRDLAKIGLSKTSSAIAARISVNILDKYYLQDYLTGQSLMQRNLASVAISEAMSGNTPVLLHLLKTKLGWSETQVIEHTGEVRSVVSSKPMSKEEFVQKYLTKDEDV